MLSPNIINKLNTLGVRHVFDKPFKTFRFTNKNIADKIFFVEPS
jgi:adenine-specific DNA methylase